MILAMMWIMGGGFTSADWTAESNQVSSWFGASVSSAGDVNGDGYHDVIIGSPLYDNGENEEGQASVFLGSAGGLATAPAWTAESDQLFAHLGDAVASAGDVNGDGFDDVIAGAPYYDDGTEDEGQAQVFYGSAVGLETNATWSGQVDNYRAWYGLTVSGAGDVNGDGFDDVVVGAPENGDDAEGAVFVYHGSAAGLSGAADWTAEADVGGADFGLGVAFAGDVDGDGFDDLLVGASYYEGEGRTFLYFGSATSLAADHAWASGSGQDDSFYGFSVAGAGDLNGDGYSDLVIGSPKYDNGQMDEGGAFAYFGSAAGPGALADWTAESNQGGASFGESVSSAGDLNADGYDDLVVGAPSWASVATDEGGAFVFFGTTTGPQAVAAYTLESGEYFSYFGGSVAPGGDVDADGYDDILVGAKSYDNVVGEGRVFLFAGIALCVDSIDSDGDDVGDLCDACPGFDDRLDTDIDGLADGCDICPDLFDPLQEDDDADGIGDACDLCPAGAVDADLDGYCEAEDCDDNNPTVYLGAYELCDGLDNSCAGTIDPAELDGDGDGEPTCAGDCDDANPELFSTQTEICNGLDDNCDGDLSPDEVDADGDDRTVCGGDCDDFSARRSPELTDICGDGIDNDCDGEVDQTCGADEAADDGCACNGAGSASAAPLLALALLARTIRRKEPTVGVT